QFKTVYSGENFTLTWNDVASNYRTSTTSLAGTFKLSIDLGTLTGGSTITLDPNIISTNIAAGATAYTFQRKVFYEPIGRRYWVFYYEVYDIQYTHSPASA